MDVGGATRWQPENVVSRAELLTRLTRTRELPRPLPERGRAPAKRFMLPDGQLFGVVASTTAPFCGACDRARMSADGQRFICHSGAQGSPSSVTAAAPRAAQTPSRPTGWPARAAHCRRLPRRRLSERRVAALHLAHRRRPHLRRDLALLEGEPAHRRRRGALHLLGAHRLG
jgi:hypothetical protein